jgi:hypothetical protein
MVWTKDTIKAKKSHFVNNCEVILAVSTSDGKESFLFFLTRADNLIPEIDIFPYNSKSINVRPTKKWKLPDEEQEDGREVCCFFLRSLTFFRKISIPLKSPANYGLIYWGLSCLRNPRDYWFWI